VSRLLTEAEQRATSVLKSHRAALDAVIALLLERETIDGDELKAVVAASSTPGPTAVADAPAADEGATDASVSTTKRPVARSH
jgi:cell division protease FtsH